ncbi:3447_t:CDS:2, partial [Dentiscutata erythropus]
MDIVKLEEDIDLSLSLLGVKHDKNISINQKISLENKVDSLIEIKEKYEKLLKKHQKVAEELKKIKEKEETYEALKEKANNCLSKMQIEINKDESLEHKLDKLETKID